MDARPAVAEIAADAASGRGGPAGGGALPQRARRRHRARRARARRSGASTETVVLSGGVFQNRRLLERTAERLGRAGLRVLVPERLPPNDGGIALRAGRGGRRAAGPGGGAHGPTRPTRRPILAERVFAGGENKPFGELTLADVEARAQELRDVSGWGPR